MGSIATFYQSSNNWYMYTDASAYVSRSGSTINCYTSSSSCYVQTEWGSQTTYGSVWVNSGSQTVSGVHSGSVNVTLYAFVSLWMSSSTSVSGLNGWSGWNNGDGPKASRTYSCSYPAIGATVTLDAQGGSGGTESFDIEYNTAAGSYPSITIPTKSGYSFMGYYTEEGGSGTKYINADGSGARAYDLTSSEYTTLYAYWTINAVECICYDCVINSSGHKLGKHTANYTVGITVSGSDWGSQTSLDEYYNGYKYSSCTSITVTSTASSNIVYRFFICGSHIPYIAGTDNGTIVWDTTNSLIYNSSVYKLAEAYVYTGSSWKLADVDFQLVKDSTGTVMEDKDGNIIYSKIYGVSNYNS